MAAQNFYDPKLSLGLIPPLYIYKLGVLMGYLVAYGMGLLVMAKLKPATS